MGHDFVTKMLILLISLGSLCYVYVIMKAIVGKTKVLTISNFFMIKYIVVIYIGSVLLNLIDFDYYVSGERFDLLLKMWYYTTACMFLMPIGMLMANIFTEYKPNRSMSLLLSKGIDIKTFNSSKITFIIFIPLFAISIFVLIMYRQKLGFLPIEGVFSGLSAQKLAYLREFSVRNFPGKYYRYAIFMINLPMLMLLTSFFLKKLNKGKLKYSFFFTVY